MSPAEEFEPQHIARPLAKVAQDFRYPTDTDVAFEIPETSTGANLVALSNVPFPS